MISNVNFLYAIDWQERKMGKGMLYIIYGAVRSTPPFDISTQYGAKRR